MLSPVEIAALLAAIKNAVDIFDKISGQIKGVLNKRPKEAEGGEDRWRHKVSADDKQIVVRKDGETIQTLTRADLESKLTPEHLRHIKVYEESMRKFYRRWQQLYSKRDDSSDALVNIKHDEQLTDQIKQMQQDLVGLVKFLESIGIQLDDHYMEVRSLVEKL